MRRAPGTLARIRPVAGPLLLAVFVVAAQLAPARHLAAHRDDHTHGPERPAPGAAAVQPGQAHDEGPDHDHGGWLAIFGPHLGAEDHGHDAGHDHDDARPAPPAADHDGIPATPGRQPGEHGQSSAAHFGLALLQGPPAPFLPPPSATLAAPPVAVLLGRVAVPRRQPPARGPPRLA